MKPSDTTSRIGRAGLLCLLLLAGAVATYGPFLLRHDTKILLGASDRWAYFAPMAYWMDAAIHQGEFPLWNPWTFCGSPFAANLQSAVFYPPHLLRSLLTFVPTPMNAFVGLALMTFAHLLIAGMGAYVLARSHRLSRVASVTVAVAYAFGAAMTRRVAEVWLFVAMAAWLPVILYLIHQAHRATSRRSACYYGLYTGLVFGMTILVGFPQLTIYMLVAMGAYAALLPFLEGQAIRSLPRTALVLGAAILLGVLVSAPSWVPAAEFARFSPRAKAVGEAYTYSGHWVSPLYLLRGLITFPGITWSGSCGIRMAGAGAFLLAAVSVLHPRKRSVGLFLIPFLILMDCAMGEHFIVGRFLAWIAPFKIMVPARAVLFAHLMFSMLAGFGVDAVATRARNTRTNVLRTVLVGCVAIPVLALLWRWECPDPFIAVGRVVWIIPVATSIAIALTLWRRRFWRYALPLLIFAETLVWNPAYVTLVVDHYPYPGDVARLYAPADGGAPTNMRAGDFDLEGNDFLCANMRMFDRVPVIGGYDPLYLDAVRRVIAPPGREDDYQREVSTHAVTESNYWGNLFLKRPFWLLAAYTKGPLPPKDTLYPPALTAFLNDSPSLPLRQLDHSALPSASVSATALSQPINAVCEKAFGPADATGWRQATVPLPHMEQPRAQSALRMALDSTVEMTAAIRFDNPKPAERTSSKTVVLHPGPSPTTCEWPLPDSGIGDATLVFRTQSSAENATIRLQRLTILADPLDEQGRIHMLKTGANDVSIRVSDLPEPRLLLFVEAAYPGWHAYIDGQETTIHPANDAFQAVLVPPGTHDVHFRFRSKTVFWGLFIGLATTLGIVTSMIVARRPVRHAATT